MNANFGPNTDGAKLGLINAARAEFAEYYRWATVEDASQMDALVVARIALIAGITAPREGLKWSFRDALERKCDEAERKFTELREIVRRCPSFVVMRETSQDHIKQAVFELRLPE